ncbi:MAG: 50S ribosomal protein L29 [Mycoplasmoidaceae bacterium]
MVKELRNKSNKELGQLVIKMKSKLLEYRFQESAGELVATHMIKTVKKNIAIALTILSERNVKLSASSVDYSLIEYKDNIRLSRSIRDGKSLLMLEKEEAPENSINNNPEKKKSIVNKTSKKDSKVDKKIVKKENKNEKKVSLIRKTTGRGK